MRLTRSWRFPAAFPSKIEVCQNLVGPISLGVLPRTRPSQSFLFRPNWVPRGGDLKRRSINMSTRWIPKGFHTITPNIIANDAEQAVAFFKKAFGATETYRLIMSNGKITHCELKLGDSVLNVGESRASWWGRISRRGTACCAPFQLYCLRFSTV
jgi:hypothetical protein